MTVLRLCIQFMVVMNILEWCSGVAIMTRFIFRLAVRVAIMLLMVRQSYEFNWLNHLDATMMLKRIDLAVDDFDGVFTVSAPHAS